MSMSHGDQDQKRNTFTFVEYYWAKATYEVFTIHNIQSRNEIAMLVSSPSTR